MTFVFIRNNCSLGHLRFIIYAEINHMKLYDQVQYLAHFNQMINDKNFDVLNLYLMHKVMIVEKYQLTEFSLFKYNKIW